MAKRGEWWDLQLGWAFLIGVISVIIVISTLNALVMTNQRAEVEAMQNQIAYQAGTITRLNMTLADLDDRQTFMAEKFNPLLVSRCHVDQIFYSAREIPDDYTGYVFPSYDYVTDDVYGIGIICR